MKDYPWRQDEAVNDNIDPETGLFVDDTSKPYWGLDEAVNVNIDPKTGLFVDDTSKPYWDGDPLF